MTSGYGTPRRKDGAEPQLILSLLDRDGTMGFPGTFGCTVTYTLTRNNVLRIAYRAISDKDTVISLTNHAYFNMAGDLSGPVLDQLLTVNADDITAVDDKNVPTGEMQNVAGTAFDFRKAHADRRAYQRSRSALSSAPRAWTRIMPSTASRARLRLAARLEDPKSGRVLEEWTTQAGLQVYSANYSTAAGRAGQGLSGAQRRGAGGAGLSQCAQHSELSQRGAAAGHGLSTR